METYPRGNLGVHDGKDIHRGVGSNVTCDVPSYNLVTLFPISRTPLLPDPYSICSIPLRFEQQIG